MGCRCGMNEAKEMYKQDLSAYGYDLTIAECKRIITQSIDPDTKERIIQALLRTIFNYALHMQNDDGADIMDLTAVGNLWLVEHFEEAQFHPNPIAWLFCTAKYEMLNYKLKYCYGPISLPPYRTQMIERPAFCELFDAAGVAQSLSQPINPEPVYAAMDRLPHQHAREMISMLFGLEGVPLASITEIAGGNSTTNQYLAVQAKKRHYLQLMRSFLVEHYPDYVEQYVCASPAEKAAAHSRQTFLSWARIPGSARKKLDTARRQLEQEGKPLNTYSLQKYAKADSAQIAAYLYELRQSEKEASHA